MGLLDEAIAAGRRRATKDLDDRVTRGVEGPQSAQKAQESEPKPAVEFFKPDPKREAARKAGPPASMLNNYRDGGLVKSGKTSTPYKIR